MPTVDASSYTTVAMEVIGTPEFNDLEGCPNIFGNIVYMGMIRIHKAHDMKTHYDTNLGLYQIKYIVLEFQVFFPFYLNDFLT